MAETVLYIGLNRLGERLVMASTQTLAEFLQLALRERHAFF